MALPETLEKYQILISPDSKKTQGLRVGDIVRRQYFDGTNIIYSLMCVLETGTTKKRVHEVKLDSSGSPVYNNGVIVTEEKEKDTPYFVGALLEGSAPKTTELLDFARITNLFDVDRSGALYLTASDSNAPYMDVIDGIGRNKSLSWPESLGNANFSDPKTQYIAKGDGVNAEYTQSRDGNNRILKLTKISSSPDGFCGIAQQFYESIQNQRFIIVSYKARSSKVTNLLAEIKNIETGNRDANWSERVTTEWKYCFQLVRITEPGRQLRHFAFNAASLGLSDWVEIADFNLILLESLSHFGESSAMRIGKLDEVSDPVFGTLSGYGAYIQKLYASQTAHISGTLTAGDENGFGSTFYAGKIHRNCFVNSCDVNFLSNATIDNTTLKNPTGIGNVYTIEYTTSMFAQTNQWLTKNLKKRYCFSFWGYTTKPCNIQIQQNGRVVGSVQIASDQTLEWRRLKIFFDLLAPSVAGEDMVIGIAPIFSESIYAVSVQDAKLNGNTLFFSAPQLESGEYCTQYQPTDDILSETEDYGAWFAKGGIGGTIQNPLLRLNHDNTGAIDTRTNSFRLNQDGSGFLANRNINWDENGKVTFGKDVTLNWDNLTDETKDGLAGKSIKILGENAFTLIESNIPGNDAICTPSSITLSLEEVGFISTSSQRAWFLKVNDSWVKIPDINTSQFTVLPESCYWRGFVSSSVDNPYAPENSSATFKCTVTTKDKVYSDTFTVYKQRNTGYSLQVSSSQGSTFQNGKCSTILKATLFNQNKPIDERYALDNFIFNWHRYNVRGEELELPKQPSSLTPNILELTYDMLATDKYTCDVSLPDPLRVEYPKQITEGSITRNAIKVRLPIECRPQQVRFVSDNNAIAVSDNGDITVIRPGTSSVHIIPTINAELAQTISIKVVTQSIRLLDGGNRMRLVNGNRILLN